MRREPQRWRTRFGRWIHQVGVREVTAHLRAAGHPVTPHAVYGWVAGQRQPRPDVAAILTGISGGAVRLEDVYAQRMKVRGLPLGDQRRE